MTIPDDCTVRLVDLPVKCGGMVSMSPDGHFSIFVNARLNYETQLKKLKHEIDHIINDDFNNADPIQTVEARASACRGPKGLASLRGVAPPALPPLIRASDLPPLRSPKAPIPEGGGSRRLTGGVPRFHVPITPHQTSVLRRCIADLDAFLLRDDPYLY